jgi:predicted transcriptional regulator
MDLEKIDQIDRLASVIGRSRAWILNQAADRYLEYEEWFVQQVEKGVADAMRGDTLPHDQVIAELRSKVEKTNSS